MADARRDETVSEGSCWKCGSPLGISGQCYACAIERESPTFYLVGTDIKTGRVHRVPCFNREDAADRAALGNSNPTRTHTWTVEEEGKEGNGK